MPVLYSAEKNESWLFGYAQRKLLSKFRYSTEIEGAGSLGRWNGHYEWRGPWLGTWWDTEGSFIYFTVMSGLNDSSVSSFIWRIPLYQHGILFVTSWILFLHLIGYEFKVRDVTSSDWCYWVRGEVQRQGRTGEQNQNLDSVVKWWLPIFHQVQFSSEF